MYDQTSGALASHQYSVRSLVLGRLRLRLSVVSIVVRIEPRSLVRDRFAEAAHQRPPSGTPSARSVVERELAGNAWRIR